jgi:glycosyltransferase involved in cell wall biosynthesis
MHIAFVAQPYDDVLPPSQSSIGLWTYHVGRRLAVDHRVTVYLKRPRYASDAPGTDNIQYVFVPTVPDRLQRVVNRAAKVIGQPGRPAFATWQNFFEYALLIALDLRRRRPDVIHIHNLTQFVPLVRAFNPNTAIVLHMQAEWLSQLDSTLMERRIRQVDRVVGSSDHISNLVKRRFPHLADRCVTVNNGFDPAIFSDTTVRSKSDSLRSILFVGRVSPEKGVHLLLEAFQQVGARIPDARIDIVGPGGSLPRQLIVDLSDDPHVQALARFYDGREYQAHLQDRIPAELAARVIFHGGQSQAAVAGFYRNATILVNASLSESFGMSVVEAGSLGVPAIVTRVGGMQETVLDGHTGLIVAPDDVTGLAQAMITLLEDEQRRQAMGRAAQARALDRYSWDRITGDIRHVYGEIYGQQQKHPIHA